MYRITGVGTGTNRNRSSTFLGIRTNDFMLKMVRLILVIFRQSQLSRTHTSFTLSVFFISTKCTGKVFLNSRLLIIRCLRFILELQYENILNEIRYTVLNQLLGYFTL